MNTFKMIVMKIKIKLCDIINKMYHKYYYNKLESNDINFCIKHKKINFDILNNKGVTIVELLVTVALLSVVLMFLYNLLSSVTFEKDNDYIANSNQANRIDIINTFERDLLLDNDVSIDTTNTNDTILVLNGTNNTKIYIIKVTDDTLTYYSDYNDDSCVPQKWKIKGGTLGIVKCETKGGESTSTDVVEITECTIPVYTNNVNNSKDNNNTLDDITFSFIK